MKKISLIVPCFNEVENIDIFADEAFTVLNTLKNYHTEILFIDDGSSDDTDVKIQILAEKEEYRENENENEKSRVKFLILGRNAGKELAVSAGLHNNDADAVIMVDADLQYPLEKIPEFVQKWEEGHKLVCGLRDKKQTNNWVEKMGSKYFYKLMSAISDVPINPRALDFRLLDREIINKFNTFSENGRIVRTLIDWLGYTPAYVQYQEKERQYGEASYSFLKRVNLALSAITSNSEAPLKIVGLLGIFITFFASLLIFWFLYDRWFLEVPQYALSGTYLVGAMNMWLVGVILMALGLVAYYIGVIKKEVLNRPLYSITKRNF